MITLHTFGPAFGLPDASPFVVKTLVQLKMFGQPFQVSTRGMTKAPKGKLPYIDDEGRIVADSTFIRWHLEAKYRRDLDEGLSAEQRATAWAIEKMLEDNAYWIGVYYRWCDDAAFRKVSAVFFSRIPWPVRPLVERLLRRRMRGYLHAQGMGRHAEPEMLQLAQRSIDAVAVLLGDKPYMMGAQPSGVDAIVFAMVSTMLCDHFDSPVKRMAQAHANLVAYRDRLQQQYFPELKAARASSTVLRQAA